MTFLAPPLEQWSFIEELFDAALDDDVVLARIAAGPIEGLLGRFGETAILWVEQRAVDDPKFRRMLAGVWKHMMSDEVWKRLCMIRQQS
jgi:hypothetical protein